MKAVLLERQAPVSSSPLKVVDFPKPSPKRGEVCVEVSACGICRTDLHIIEGDLEPRLLPVVPGHQIVGRVVDKGFGVKGISKGDRVGITWMNSACGRCGFCKSGNENLCDNIAFTGYSMNGGYSQYATVSGEFAYKIPDKFDDIHAAPLLCAGIIGYRALKMSGLRKGGTIAMFGFGASAHIAAQVARRWGCEIMAFTRSAEHRRLAKRLGAAWAGDATGEPPKGADAAVVFAPSGGTVLDALRVIKKGCRVAIADIYMGNIPEIDYNKYLYPEKYVGGVANYTRSDAKEFLSLAAEIPIRTDVRKFRLEEANKALLALKNSEISGAGVFDIGVN